MIFKEYIIIIKNEINGNKLAKEEIKVKNNGILISEKKKKKEKIKK